MTFVVFYCLLYVMEAITLFQYNTTLFSSSYSKRVRYSSLTVCYFLLFLIFLFHNPYANFSAFFVVNFLYLQIMNRLNFFTAIFHSLIILTSMCLSELIFTAIFFQVSYHFPGKNYLLHDIVFTAILSKMLYFFILYFISHYVISSKENQRNLHKGNPVLYFVPILSFGIISIYFYICTTVELGQIANYLFSISALLLLFINVIIFGLYSHLQKKSAEFAHLQIQLQKEYDFSEYYKALIQQDERQKIFIHDIKNHLQSIAAWSEQKNFEKISSYLDQLLQSQDLQSSVHICESEMLNAILCRYSRICAADHIAFHADIRNRSINFVTDDDLTALFCNLLDNAVESCRKSNSAFLELSVAKQEHSNLCVITMQNSCPVDPFSKTSGQLISSKKNPSRHGFGLKSIQRIALKYSGELRTYYDTKHHSFHTILILKEFCVSRADPNPFFHHININHNTTDAT